MSLAIQEFAQVWTLRWTRSHPLRFIGILLHLVLRTSFAVFWLAAGINKVVKGWLTSDILKEIFLDRLTEKDFLEDISGQPAISSRKSFSIV